MAARFGRRIEVGDPGDGWAVRLAGSRHGSEDDAVLILRRVAQAHRLEFAEEDPAQLELSR